MSVEVQENNITAVRQTVRHQSLKAATYTTLKKIHSVTWYLWLLFFASLWISLRCRKRLFFLCPFVCSIFPTEFCFVFFPSSVFFHHCPISIFPGWTGEKVCLAGDSAGGNLSVTTSMRAAAFGVRMPDGIVAAYPATLLTAYASPSRLLTLMDPLLPLSVLSRCLSAYAGRRACVGVCVWVPF